jgi:uncharacterized protein (TIGR00251 family)
MPFYRPVRDGLTLSIRVTPKASRDAIGGVMAMPEGEALKVAVTAPADKGKANEAVCALLAEKLGLPKTALTVMSGHTDRRKVLHAAGDANALIAHVKQWTPE